MQFLPVIERELRVQARRPSTVWLRVAVGLLAAVTGFNLLDWGDPGAGVGGAGQAMLQGLAWIALVFCLVEGVRATGDSLSQERREGTLGLLFLTDLRGIDVVLGKLVAATVRSFYGLAAAFPVMGLALAAGGVTAGEFWRIQLVLLHALFLAAACGLWVSAVSLDAQRATLGAFGLVASLTLLPALAYADKPLTGWPSVSPAVLLNLAEDTAFRADPVRFWVSMAGVQALGWALLAWAGHELPRRDLETRVATRTRRIVKVGTRGPDDWHYRIPPSLHAAHGRRDDRRSIDRDPAHWLARRRPASRWAIWTAVLLPSFSGTTFWLLMTLLGWPLAPVGLRSVSSGMGLVASLVPAVLLGMVASRRFIEARKSGTLELLLSTPLTAEAMVRGEWRGLWDSLRVPLGLLVLLLGAPYLVLYLPEALAGRVAQPVGPVLLLQLLRVAETPLYLIAMVWVGLWSGVRAGTAAAAVGHTVWWTVLVPWLGTALLSLGVHGSVGGRLGGAGGWWIWGVLAHLCAFGYGAWLIRWARRRLHGRLRPVLTGALTGRATLNVPRWAKPWAS